MITCAFCSEPAERVCSWPVKRDYWNRPTVLCDKPVCFRHMREPGEMAYCADHWAMSEPLPYVPEWQAQQADADPDRWNPPKRRRARA